MEKMKIWFDEEGDLLEIGFGKKKGYFRDVGNDIWERVEEGVVKGIIILNFKKRTKGKKAEIELPLKITLEPVEA
ncbi:DUF2283 domain-containing protein [Candidatus Pyrohabitans sp.]|jgi:hypothetical protein